MSHHDLTAIVYFERFQTVFGLTVAHVVIKLYICGNKQNDEAMINLVQRIFSGAIYIALIVAAILLLDNSPVMYLLVFPLLIVVGKAPSHGSSM